ncbi:MAG: beta-ketoacyl synthase N-terminal-like domain-containing protein, partial [Leptolyngbyaceae cyanobacterium]
MSGFTCLLNTPAGLAHPGLALAAARAGGVAVLNLEFHSEQDEPQIRRNLTQLLARLEPSVPLGLRFSVDQAAMGQVFLEQLASDQATPRPHWLVLTDWETADPTTLDTLLSDRSPLRTGVLEISGIDLDLSLQKLEEIQGRSLPIKGILARGTECGGWVGPISAFVLTQKLLTSQPYPVYVQGGIGLHTAAACRNAGAAGVVLADQLWLMAESPLSTEQQQWLRTCKGQEAVLLGEGLGQPCRVLMRPHLTGAQALQQLAQTLELGPDGEETDSKADWRVQAAQRMGWDERQTLAWPVGQAIALAASLSDRYRTTGRLIQALLQTSEQQVAAAQTCPPLRPDAPLAQSHRTRYPLVQGPMTRVSDTTAFAAAVAKEGALPLLALAMMREPQVEALLSETQATLGSRPWGVGILGFVPPDLRAEQLRMVHHFKPPFALIAGGRPDQAAQLEANGIATYLHVPTPKLLSQFLAQGARRFVFEGRECGGHVGPLGSFVLWETMIEVLLREVQPQWADQVHVLFAGGIHDACSSRLINGMIVSLAERGIRCGALMGTAYLFTTEAVVHGAVVPRFQTAAQQCNQTVNLQLGPGHAIRCTTSPFTDEFIQTRRHLLRAGLTGKKLHDELEKLTLGRLRVASKGLERDTQGQLAALAGDRQWQRGMYMMGQVALLRQGTCAIAQLHEAVCGPQIKPQIGPEIGPEIEPEAQGASEQRDRKAASIPITQGRGNAQIPVSEAVPIAIIGMASVLPGSQNPGEFWQNILNQVNAITEVPADQWDWHLYYDPDPKAPDKSYSKWGGFINDMPFDPMVFGIPPKVMKSIAPAQLLALATAQRALDDAGYGDGHYDRENTAVIFANADGGGGTFGHLFITRTLLPLCIQNLPLSPRSDQAKVDLGDNGSGGATPWDHLPEWTEATYPGTLDNVVSGRIANRLDLGGKNLTVDSACASSLSAIDLAVQELANGHSNLVIAGAVDTTQSPYAFVAFSKTQALSPQGQPRTFDQDADGIAIGEGTGVVILKRLADAERDGDRIYAVLRAVAGSSDGKALGLTAPRPQGQMRALTRAYERAGINPNTLGMVEAHGTGTVVGDRAELETITTTLTQHGAAAKSCALGSVKTLIGHTKAVAGIAGLIKTALALHHQVLPPHYGVERPLDPIADPDTPVFLLRQARPWLPHPHYPRRAGLSAFGFGGTNVHAVVEEYQGDCRQPPVGSPIWPYELLVFRDKSQTDLVQQLTHLQQALAQGARPTLRDLAFTYAKQAEQRQDCPLCLCLVVADDLSHRPSVGRQPQSNSPLALEEALEAALTFLHDPDRPGGKLPTQMVWGNQAQVRQRPIAFLFPGQGSQYPNMAREAALYFPELRSVLAAADQLLYPEFSGMLSQLIYPPGAYTEAEKDRYKQDLTQTQVAQPALGTISAGFLDLATRLGLEPTMVAGHSYGELSALHCAGVLEREAFFRLSALRGRLVADHLETQGSQPESQHQAQDDVSDLPPGTGAMAAISMGREQVEALCRKFPGIVLANHNAPQQCIISGERSVVQQAMQDAANQGIDVKLLNVAAAFHSPQVSPVVEALAAAIAPLPLHPPQIPIYANSTARPYESTSDAIRDRISQHLAQPVRFVEQIEQMYQDGARVFIELGPKNVLTNLVNQILPNDRTRTDRTREDAYTAVSLDGQGRGLRGLLLGLGQLLSQGVPLKLTALFQGRSVQLLNLSRLVETTRPSPPAATTWFVSGTYARPHQDSVGALGKLPLLTQATGQTSAAPDPAQPDRPPTAPHSSNRKTAVSPSSPVSMTNFPISASATPSSANPAASADPLAAPINYHANGTPMPGASPIFATSPNPSHYPGTGHFSGTVEAPNAAAALKAYQMYQETMRQFLMVQEQVMGQFLNPGLNNGLNPRLNNGIAQAQSTAPVQGIAPQMVPQLPQPPQSPQPVPPAPPVAPLSVASPSAGTALNREQTPPLAPSVAAVDYHTDQSSLEPEVKESPQSAPALNEANLTQLLVDLISENTGYPPDMLGLDLDLEADLGIDSIRRTEIFGTLRQQLPAPVTQRLDDQMEQVSRVKSINALVAALLAIAREVGSEAPAQAVSQDPTQMRAEAIAPDLSNPDLSNPNITPPDQDKPGCPRFVFRANPTPLTAQAPQRPDGIILVTTDRRARLSAAIATQVVDQLSQQGATVSLLDSQKLNDPVALAQQLDHLRLSHHQKIGGILHLAPLMVASVIETLQDWQHLAQIQVKGLFHLLQLCGQDFKGNVASTGMILTASVLGGTFGRGEQCGPGSPLAGGCQGLVKTACSEWPGLRGKVLDFDATQSEEFIAEAIAQEFLHPEGTSLEVGYPRTGRATFSVVPTPPLPHSLTPPLPHSPTPPLPHSPTPLHPTS